MQAISKDSRDPNPDLVGLLHSPELEAELQIIDPAVLAGVIGKVGDLDDEWFSAFDDSVAPDDGYYFEDASASSRPRAPLRLVFAFGAAATAALVGLAAM